MNTTFIIKTVEQVAIVALSAVLGYLAEHGADLSPSYGPILGAASAACLVALNRHLNNPVVKMLSVAKR